MAIGYGAWDFYASRLVKREYTRIREKGAPLYFSEVIRNTVPDQDNAALLYIQASQELKLPAGYAFQITAPQSEKAAIIRDNPKVMQLIERASALSQCRFPVESGADPNTWLNPYLTKSRELARFIRLNAYDNARRKDYDKAFQQIGFIYQLAERVGNGDTLIDFLVARAIYSMGIHTASTILHKERFTKAQAQKYFSLLPALDWHALFLHSLRNERAFTISSYTYNLADIWNRRISEDELPDWDDTEDKEFKHRGFLTRPLLKLDEMYALRLWTKVLLAAQKPGAIDTDYEKQLEENLDQLPLYAKGTRNIHETFVRVFTNRDYPETSQYQQEIAFALNAYKTEQGTYPSTLAQAEQFWGSKFPLDPYTNRPFLYRADKDNFTLYSVGIDRVDNGGIKQPEGKWDFSKINDLIWGNYPP